MFGRYHELYRRSREALEADAEAKLKRPLTIQERNLFRSCGTLTMLETLGMTVYYAHTSEELAEKLAETSMESRFKLALQETVDHLTQLLERKMTNEEQQQLWSLGNTEELWILEEQIKSSPSQEREQILRKILLQSTGN